jgi:hypothetical protein
LILLFLLMVTVFALFLAIFAGPEIIIPLIVGTAIAVALLFGIMFVTLALRILIDCTISALLGAVGDIGAGVPTVVGAAIASGAVVNCQDARDLLAMARAALAAAEIARNRQAERVQEAKRSVQNATDMLIVAIASLAAAIFQPWLIPGVVAAILAAAEVLRRRSARLFEELAALAAREAEVLRALADVAAAEALVATLCATATTDQPDDAPGILDGGEVPVFTTSP